MELKDKLKNIRTGHNLSQNEFAKKLFVSRSTITKWENGLGMPKKVYLEKICEMFNIKRDYLIDDLENENYQLEKNLKIHRLKILTAILSLLLLCIIAGIVAVISYFSINNDSKMKRIEPPTLSINNIECSFSLDNLQSNYKYSAGQANVKYMSESYFTKEFETLSTIDKSDKYYLDPKYFDEINIYYYWYDNDFCFYEITDDNPNQEIRNTYNDKFVKLAEVNDNYFLIPENDYHNLIEIRIKLQDYYFIYYYLAV